MNPTLARLLTRLYPPAWRDRYGAEFEAFLQTGQGGLRTSVNVAWSALCEHVFPMRVMQQSKTLPCEVLAEEMDASINERFLFWPQTPDQIITVNLRVKNVPR